MPVVSCRVIWRCFMNTVLALTPLLSGLARAQYAVPPVPMPSGAWRFIVSGDSRDCGDIVMPAIAAHSARYTPTFYWHLGDLRAIYKIDEDMAFAAANNGEFLSCSLYLPRAWPDFIEHQIAPFGSLPFYVGIGNHEVIPPANEFLFRRQFAAWLDQKSLKDQRAQDDADDAAAGIKKENRKADCEKKCEAKEKKEAAPVEPAPPPDYYHWVVKGVDFIYLANPTDSFPPDQLDWFQRVLRRDAAKKEVKSVVVGMHEALPDSLANNHSMGSSKNPDARPSGEAAYNALLDFRDLTKKEGMPKNVYVLSSHSHFYMEDIFQTDELRKKGEPLNGWIVGTAGAERYKLPVPASDKAKTDVYGYLVGTVAEDGTIEFKFQEIREMDLTNNIRRDYPQTLVHWCFAHNSQNTDYDSGDVTPQCEP